MKVTKPPLPEMDLQRLMEFWHVGREGIVFYADDGTILDCNDAFAALMGRPVSRLLGSNALELFSASDHLVAQRHMHLNAGLSHMAKIPRPGMEPIKVEISGGMSNWGGKPCHFASVRDLSVQMETTERLRRSQARYRALVENTDQIAILDQDRLVVYASPSAIRHFRCSEEQMYRTPSIHLLHPDDRAFALQRRKEMLTGDPDRTLMVRTISPPSEALQPGSTISWVRFHGSLIDWEGKPTTLIFFTDLTQQREIEEAMSKALAQERELGDLKTRFVSMASHEFRTPLATIQSSTDLLAHYSERLSAAERQDTLVEIERAVTRMQHMMDSFLAFGRLTDGVTACKPQPLALWSFASRIAHECAGSHGHQHAIHITAQQGIDQKSAFMLDETLLAQMLGNLLNNACKYSPFDRPIMVCFYREQDASGKLWLGIDVIDRGIGIPSEDLQRLFVSFHRASNVGSVSGTGLGLAIVDRATRAHGGEVRVESELGAGSRFTLRLPWVVPGGLDEEL
jgi:PAS domain S-box-containing protein